MMAFVIYLIGTVVALSLLITYYWQDLKKEDTQIEMMPICVIWSWFFVAAFIIGIIRYKYKHKNDATEN